MITKGARVTYVGPVMRGLDIGDEGMVVLSEKGAHHVAWKTGYRAGKIDLIEDLDLSMPTARMESTAASLYAIGGAPEVVHQMNQDGQLESFAMHLEGVTELVASQLAEDPAFMPVLAQLKAEQGRDVCLHAAKLLLKTAFQN